MRILIQRVKSAQVVVEGQEIAGIQKGLLLFVGIGKDDEIKDVEYLCKKVSNLRIFGDERGKMNLNIQQVNGQILSVSQFTLYANTKKGNRPGFDRSADPEMAKEMAVQWGHNSLPFTPHIYNDASLATPTGIREKSKSTQRQWWRRTAHPRCKTVAGPP